MITAGIDAGQETIKVAIVTDGKLVSHVLEAAGGESTMTVSQRVLERAAGLAGINQEHLEYIVATGTGRKQVALAHEQAPDLPCLARGAIFLEPKARTVIDMGGEKCLVLRCNAQGKPVSFTLNDKCASGAGIFFETVAKMLRVPIEEVGPLSLQSGEDIKIHSICAVFAESEVVSLVHKKVKPADILRGIHEGVALRILAMLTKTGIEKDVMMTGGVARNLGFVKAIEQQIGLVVVAPAEAPIAAALGAALLARDKKEKQG